MRLALLLVAALALPACRAAARFDTPLPDDGSFARGEPTAEELSRYRLAAAYSAANGGLSVLVLRGDRVVFEEQQHGNLASSPHHLFSGTKSFSCALAVAAIEDGLLGLDEQVSDTIPELSADERKRRITVRQLLDFTSGLDPAFWSLTRDGLLAEQKVRDKYATAVGLALSHEPGARFVYGNSHLMLFGELMRRKLKGDPLAYLSRRVLDPIGFRAAGWIRDPAGNPMLPYGAFTTAREWARYGVLLRDGGRFRGKQLLPEAGLASCRKGSAAMPAYGLTLWLNARVPEGLNQEFIPAVRLGGPRGYLYEGGPADLFAAAGHEDNRLYVVPSRGLVVVRLGSGDRAWRDAAFLARLLDGKEL